MAIGSKEVFAKNLKTYMEAKGKTQKELAEIVGVSAPTINDWIKAKKYPRIDNIEALAEYFGILKSDLIEEKLQDTQTKKAEGKTIGDLLKEIRIAKQLSLAECSSELGISIEELRQYENGNRQIPINTIGAMATVFGVSPGNILERFIISLSNGNNHDLSHNYIKQIKRWTEHFGYVAFTIDEQDQLFDFAKFLVWKRENK